MPVVTDRRTGYSTLATRLGFSGGTVVAGSPRVLPFTSDTNGTYQNNSLIGATDLVITIDGVVKYPTADYTFNGSTGTITWANANEAGLNGSIQY